MRGRAEGNSGYNVLNEAAGLRPMGIPSVTWGVLHRRWIGHAAGVVGRGMVLVDQEKGPGIQAVHKRGLFCRRGRSSALWDLLSIFQDLQEALAVKVACVKEEIGWSWASGSPLGSFCLLHSEGRCQDRHR